MLTVTNDDTVEAGLDSKGRFHPAANVFGEGPGLRYIRDRNEDQKFLATIPCDLVTFVPHATLDGSGNLYEAAISLGTAEAVVETLEVVDVAHDAAAMATAMSV